MTPISREKFADLISNSTVRPRLRRELRYVPEEIPSWEEKDFLTVTNRQGNEGVLVIPGTTPFIQSFLLQTRRPNAAGRLEAIICDICATWQRGTHSASITFTKEQGSVTFLVCADLACSSHVRNQTAASKLSRAQLREHIDTSGRIKRLKERLAGIAAIVQGN